MDNILKEKLQKAVEKEQEKRAKNMEAIRKLSDYEGKSVEQVLDQVTDISILFLEKSTLTISQLDRLTDLDNPTELRNHDLINLHVLFTEMTHIMKALAKSESPLLKGYLNYNNQLNQKIQELESQKLAVDLAITAVSEEYGRLLEIERNKYDQQLKAYETSIEEIASLIEDYKNQAITEKELLDAIKNEIVEARATKQTLEILNLSNRGKQEDYIESFKIHNETLGHVIEASKELTKHNELMSNIKIELPEDMITEETAKELIEKANGLTEELVSVQDKDLQDTIKANKVLTLEKELVTTKRQNIQLRQSNRAMREDKQKFIAEEVTKQQLMETIGVQRYNASLDKNNYLVSMTDIGLHAVDSGPLYEANYTDPEKLMNATIKAVGYNKEKVRYIAEYFSRYADNRVFYAVTPESEALITNAEEFQQLLEDGYIATHMLARNVFTPSIDKGTLEEIGTDKLTDSAIAVLSTMDIDLKEDRLKENVPEKYHYIIDKAILLANGKSELVEYYTFNLMNILAHHRANGLSSKYPFMNKSEVQSAKELFMESETMFGPNYPAILKNELTPIIDEIEERSLLITKDWLVEQSAKVTVNDIPVGMYQLTIAGLLEDGSISYHSSQTINKIDEDDYYSIINEIKDIFLSVESKGRDESTNRFASLKTLLPTLFTLKEVQ